MRKAIHFTQVLILSLFLAVPASATDSTSFDPLPIPISATSTSVPVGTIMVWPSSSLPPLEGGVQKWAECNGQSLPQVDHPELLAQLGTTNLPDLRGEFIRGWDNGRGVDAGRRIGSGQEDQIERHRHVAPYSGDRAYAPWGETNRWNYRGSNRTDSNNPRHHTNDGSDYDGVVNPPGVIGDETRPRNVAMMYLMRVLP